MGPCLTPISLLQRAEAWIRCAEPVLGLMSPLVSPSPRALSNGFDDWRADCSARRYGRVMAAIMSTPSTRWRHRPGHRKCYQVWNIGGDIKQAGRGAGIEWLFCEIDSLAVKNGRFVRLRHRRDRVGWYIGMMIYRWVVVGGGWVSGYEGNIGGSNYVCQGTEGFVPLYLSTDRMYYKCLFALWSRNAVSYESKIFVCSEWSIIALEEV